MDGLSQVPVLAWSKDTCPQTPEEAAKNESSSLIALSKHWCITREKGRKNNKIFLNKLNLSGQKCRAAHKTEEFPLKHSNLLKQEREKKN